MDYQKIFEFNKERSLFGRYICNDHITSLLDKHAYCAELAIAGRSVEEKPIYSIQVGSGNKRILMWSQMHGNESTATKALFDLFNLLCGATDLATSILESCTICFVPILNPDGAKAYTRTNAAGVDLNRDFVELSQPESRTLIAIVDKFKPHFNFNLHDQRTIFGVGETRMPATISFLAPAYNEATEWNTCRSEAADVIVAMNKSLQYVIPGQVGRFDDTFNINCAGDNFQSKNIPTILVEAGHFAADYERNIVRKYCFTALLSGIKHIGENVIVADKIDEYLNIPQNKVGFFDFVYKNIRINYDGIEIITNFASQYTEVLLDGKITFAAYIAEVGSLDDFYGHSEYDAQGALYTDDFKNIPEPGQKADFQLGEIRFKNGVAVF